MKIELTDRQLRDINIAILIYLNKLRQDDQHQLIQSYLKILDYIDEVRDKNDKTRKN